MQHTQTNHNTSKAVGHLKTGFGLKKDGYMATFFGCTTCPFFDSPNCPHYGEVGIMDDDKPKYHANGVCSERGHYIETIVSLSSKSKVRMLQVDQIMKTQIQLDKLYADWAKTGEVHNDYPKLQKNFFKLLTDMRRQDEGMKMNIEIDNTLTELRDLIDAKAEVVQDADFVKTIDNKDHGRTKEEERKEVRSVG